MESFGVYRPVIRATDSKGEARQRKHRIIGSTVPGYDMILGMEWIEVEDPDLHYPDKQ